MVDHLERCVGIKIEDTGERLVRIEEQIRHILDLIKKLDRRDGELDEAMRSLSEKLASALLEQASTFREALEKISGRFASRDDLALVRSLVLAAVGALLGSAWRIISK